MIELMTKQQAMFVNYLREHGLSYETYLRVSFPKLVDDGAFIFLL